MKISIEGKTIETAAGQSVLQAALDNGVFIPHLCGHPDLEAKGGCRLCSVEIDGNDEAVPACMTQVKEGMNIRIYGEKADKIRKAAMELILATHPAECTGCPKYGKCELQSMYQFLGVSPERLRKQSRTLANDSSNPLITHLFTRCIRCGRCIRACHDLRGVKVLDYVRDQAGIHAGIPEGKTLKEAGCRFCGACIEVCPTGSIVDSVDLLKEEKSYAESVVPCQTACPAHIDIPRYIRYIKNGEPDKAVAVIREKVPFPKTLGSICNHVCENDCKRNHLGEPISICRLKLSAAHKDDYAWKQRRALKAETGKKAAIIGAGPAGLTAAYYLAKQGHAVTIFEAQEKAGGQCRYGIPAYRLPDYLLDSEIEDILELGVHLQTSSPKMKPGQLLAEGFDTVLVATGTHQGIKLPVTGNELSGVLINTEFLRSSRQGINVLSGAAVIVLGGGNVAYDCARTAIRQGAKEVHIACLETRDKMTSDREEITDGEAEGVILHDGYSFLKIEGESQVTGVVLQKIKNFYFDEQRRPVMELVEGSEEVIKADYVIFAAGQRPRDTDRMELELTHNYYIKVGPSLDTSVPGVYAAGDVVTGTNSVIAAVAAGRKSAEEMDRYMGGDGNISETLIEPETNNPYLGEYPGFADLDRRQPVDEETAVFEASRCLQCDLRLDLTRPKLWNEY